MERVRIVRFAEPDTAWLAARFLGLQGFDADVAEAPGKGLPVAFVLVARHQAGAAYDLLRRVSRGDFAAGMPDADTELSEAAAELSVAVRGTGVADAIPTWLNILPIPVIGGLLVLLVLLQMAIPAVRDFIAIHMGW